MLATAHDLAISEHALHILVQIYCTIPMLRLQLILLEKTTLSSSNIVIKPRVDLRKLAIVSLTLSLVATLPYLNFISLRLGRLPDSGKLSPLFDLSSLD